MKVHHQTRTQALAKLHEELNRLRREAQAMWRLASPARQGLYIGFRRRGLSPEEAIEKTRGNIRGLRMLGPGYRPPVSTAGGPGGTMKTKPPKPKQKMKSKMMTQQKLPRTLRPNPEVEQLQRKLHEVSSRIEAAEGVAKAAEAKLTGTRTEFRKEFDAYKVASESEMKRLTGELENAQKMYAASSATIEEIVALARANDLNGIQVRLGVSGTAAEQEAKTPASATTNAEVPAMDMMPPPLTPPPTVPSDPDGGSESDVGALG